MTMMKKLSILAICLLSSIVLANSAAAQEWSQQQKEVWEAIETCNAHFVNKDIDAALACFHDDFSGWLHGQPVPRGKDSIKKLLPYRFETRTVRAP